MITEFEGSVKVDCAAERTGYDASASSSGQSPVVANSAVLEAALAAACNNQLSALSHIGIRPSLPTLEIKPQHIVQGLGQVC